ncbi:hypothetical protein FKM82_005055 [Ascaphus truei]
MYESALYPQNRLSVKVTASHPYELIIPPHVSTKDELQKRNEIIRSLTKRIKVLESQQQDGRTTLESTQQQLLELTLRASDASDHCQDLEEKNQSLNDSVLEFSSHVGRLQAREQELATLLRLKDKDIIEATNHITEFTSRFKELEAALRGTRLGEASAIREVQDLKPRLKGLKTEVEKLKDDFSQKTAENNEQREEIIRFKQESGYLQTELVFAAERDKRKDQLLQLAKSKQDRTDTELQNLRQVGGCSKCVTRGSRKPVSHLPRLQGRGSRG